ncbi:unnamed protein product, partial [Linum tenue]
ISSLFWSRVDPYTLNRQGNDAGTQYRSGIYYYDENQARLARESKEARQSELKGQKGRDGDSPGEEILQGGRVPSAVSGERHRQRQQAIRCKGLQRSHSMLLLKKKISTS